MRSSNITYEPRLDHLRFLAATLVFLFHVYHFFYVGTKNLQEPEWIGLIAEGHTGVSLFFVLSGFIFMKIALQSEYIEYGRFMRNRFLRIAPLFLVFFFIAISVGRDDFKGYYIFYTLFSNLGEAPTSGTFITGAAWTISVEFTFYLIFPFLAVFMKERGALYVLKLLLLILMIKLASFNVSENSNHMFYSTLVGRIDQFIIGMLFAYIYSEYHKTLQTKGMFLFVAAACVVYLNSYIQAKYASYFLDDPKQVFWITWSLQEAIGWGMFILGYLLMPYKIPNLLDKFMCRIGEVSYSFYLFHGMVIYLFSTYIGVIEPFPVDMINIILNTTVIFCMVWFVATLSYQTIEQPFLAMRKRYTTPSTSS